MNPTSLVAAFAIAAAPLLAVAAETPEPRRGEHPFDVHDLVMLDRVSDPQLAPDGRAVAFSVRSTDYAANKGVTSLWLLDLAHAGAAPVKLATGSDPRWSADGTSIFYLADARGSSQVWRVAAAGGEPLQVTDYPLDVGTFRVAPDGRHLALSIDVFPDCESLACSKARLDAHVPARASGRLYDRLFVRHWDQWADGRRSQLFLAALAADGKAATEPRRLTPGIDGDVPSKPDGSADEYVFSPDGRTLYFGARIAGHGEPWSTNFDVHAVALDGDGDAAPRNLTAGNPAWDAFPLPSPDGRTLYYLAMRRAGFEADRFAIMALDLASGIRREVAANWDRSAGPLAISVDGRTLYTVADDEGQRPLFAIDVASGETRRVVAGGTVTGFAVGPHGLIVARQDFTHPTDLYSVGADGEDLTPVTHFNAERLAGVRFGEAEFFSFRGWNDSPVQGYVVKPVDYQPGRKYPVAFLIHGGPQGAWHNDFHYRWNPGIYAGAGFAVVAINFHGSTGYGQAFTDSISGDWGGKPLEDLKRGWSAALQKYPFLDADRACALGASYGGYMVYWMAGVWNQPWKCFVDHDGVFDSRSMYYATDELWFEEWEHGGPQYVHPANYEKFNPLNHVGDWRVPMLVIQGGRDYRIPDEQSLGAFTALQRRGIPSQLLYFPDEHHHVLKPQNSVMWHDTVLAWIRRWTATTGKE